MNGWLGIYLRGVAMGTADLVPGVSGGTIALITGIYARLLTALSQANGATVMLLARGHFGRCWERIDGSFLLVLAAGIGTAIVVFAEGIQFLLAHYPLVLWSFFFGLVLASAVMLLVTELSAGDRLGYLLVVLGASAAALIGLLPQGSIASLPGAFFPGGDAGDYRHAIARYIRQLHFVVARYVLAGDQCRYRPRSGAFGDVCGGLCGRTPGFFPRPALADAIFPQAFNGNPCGIFGGVAGDFMAVAACAKRDHRSPR